MTTELREQTYAGDIMEFMLRESDYLRHLHNARKQWKALTREKRRYYS